MKAREYLINLYNGHIKNYVTAEQLAKQNNVDVGTMQVLIILGSQLSEEEEDGTD